MDAWPFNKAAHRSVHHLIELHTVTALTCWGFAQFVQSLRRRSSRAMRMDFVCNRAAHHFQPKHLPRRAAHSHGLTWVPRPACPPVRDRML